jgi:hypothetical protein
MNTIEITLGAQTLIYELIPSPLSASWVNWLYAADPVGGLHEKFGGHYRIEYSGYYTIGCHIDLPPDIITTQIQASWYPCFNHNARSGDLVMGWHTQDLELRRAFAMRDLELIKHRKLARVKVITPEIKLMFGTPVSTTNVHLISRDLLWWLYENHCTDIVQHMGFEIQCHGDPLLARLRSPRPWQVLDRIQPGDQITRVKITPPACF